MIQKTIAKALMIGVSLSVAVGAAHGENIRYENPGGAIDFNYMWIDVTKPAHMQPGIETASSVQPRAEVRFIEFGYLGYVGLVGANGMRSIEVEDYESSSLLNPRTYRTGGGEVGPDTVDSLNAVKDKNGDFNYSWNGRGAEHTAWEYGIGEAIVETAYPSNRSSLPFRFTLPDGVHYGWIEYDGNGNHNADSQHSDIPDEEVFADINIYAWGWQTTPGEPVTIGIPSPASVSLFAVAGLAGLRRRR